MVAQLLPAPLHLLAKEKKKKKSSWVPALGLIPRSSIPATRIPPGVTHSHLANGNLLEMVAMVMGNPLLPSRCGLKVGI